MGHTNFLSSSPWHLNTARYDQQQYIIHSVHCTVHASRRAVERILVEEKYNLLNRFRLEITLHNPGHQVSTPH
jgi:hypothetical protein